MSDAQHAVDGAAARLRQRFPWWTFPSCGIVSSAGDVVATTERQRSGSLGCTVDTVSSFFGTGWTEGDVAITNDPFGGGTHVNDFTVVRHSGSYCIGVQVRVPDMGGFNFGGFAPDAFDIWGEGTRFTPLRIRTRGRPEREALQLTALNTRTPALQAALFSQATAAADFAADQGGDDLDLSRRSTDVRFNAIEDESCSLRSGTYLAMADVERADGGSRLTVRLHAEVTGERMSFGLSESDPQCDAPYNLTRGATMDACLSAVLMYAPHLRSNTRAHRHIEVHVGKGSIVGASPPAATGFGIYFVSEAVRTVVGEVLTQAGAVNVDQVSSAGEGRRSFASLVDPQYMMMRDDVVDEMKNTETTVGGTANE
jgi:N-methylhydantoinase B